MGMLLTLGIIIFSGNFTHSALPPFLSLNLFLFLLASLLANFHGGALVPISDTKEFLGRAELVSDPRLLGRGVIFRAKLISDGSKEIVAEVSAYGQQRYQLSGLLTGEWVNLKGRLKKLSADRSSGKSYFPVQAQLQVYQVGNSGGGPIHFKIANGIRRNLEAGAESLSEHQKALYTGVIYGDDRNQSLAQKDLFRSTGLTHILAVSGQNVAFLLAIFYPLIKSLNRVFKMVLIVLVLLLFLTMTRFEPSVMRAVVMAVTAFFSSSFLQNKGEVRIRNPKLKILYESIHPKSILGIAICLLILISPPIVSRLAFQLSVMASAGIIFVSPTLGRKLFGPKWFRTSLAITISAQLAVAPLILSNFGALALSSLPANIFALPAVGFVTIWGMTAGLLAGVLGGTLAQIIHIPTKFLLGWVDLVARFSDSLNLGWLNSWHIGILFVSIGLGLGLFIIQGHFSFRVYSKLKYVKFIVVGLISFTVISPTLSNTFLQKSEPQYITPEVFYWDSQSFLAIKSNPGNTNLLSILSQRQITDIELLVFLYTPSEVILEALNERYSIKSIFVPRGKYIARTTPYSVGQRYLSERLILSFPDSETVLQVCLQQEIESQENQNKYLSCYTL